MPYSLHGGSYPYTSSAAGGGRLDVNEYCMAVGVNTKGSTANGWTNNGHANDCPSSDSDWPNKSYNHGSPYLTVWLK